VVGDEGAEQVDAIGGGDLGLEDLAEAGLAAGVEEEIAGAEGDGGLGQEGAGLAEVVIRFEAGLFRDQLGQDPPAEVELLGLGVVALLGVEGQGQEAVDIAGQQAGALGLFGGFGDGGEPLAGRALGCPGRGPS